MENSLISGDNKKARDELVVLGFPEREASIYLALLTRGESKDGDIASSLGLHRLDVYHDLKSMQSKNIVEATIAKPIKFRAVPLETVIESMQKAEKEHVILRSRRSL